MSQRCIGYEGEGKHRRPLWATEGPASAAATSAMAMIGRLAVPDSDDASPTGGAGPIERRMATEAQRDAWRVADDAPARSSIEDIPTSVPWRPEPGSIAARTASGRHAARVLATVPGPTVSARTIEEQPVMAIYIKPPEDDETARKRVLEQDPAESLGIRIAVVAEAAAAASDAWSELQMAAAAERAAEAALAAAETRWDDARAALETSWRSTGIGLEASPSVWDAERRHEQLLNGDAPAVVESPADHAETIPVAERLTDPDDSPEVVARPRETPAASMASVAAQRGARAAGGGPRLSASQELLLQAVNAAGGNLRAAAIALGVPGQAVQTSLRHIGEKGGIPIELIPLLPAGYAKYSRVAG